MTEGHTRGPWKYGWETSAREWALVTNSAWSVVANVNSESGPDAQSVPATRKMPAEANARLIAASPDLLEAARKALAFLAVLAGDLDPHGTKINVRAVSDDGSRVLATIAMQDVIDAARANELKR